MQIKTKTVAKWQTQKVGKAKREIVAHARGLVVAEARDGIPAPEYIEVPDSIAQRHHRKHPANLRAGRPPLDGETKTVHQVRLTAAQVDTARRLGDGNVSAGIRRALDTANC